uniref:Uncharacterized protein n=1 Tax=viral metagenome TaxID=1070528 RepID=A0A6C0H833_9ZZZZ
MKSKIFNIEHVYYKFKINNLNIIGSYYFI